MKKQQKRMMVRTNLPDLWETIKANPTEKYHVGATEMLGRGLDMAPTISNMLNYAAIPDDSGLDAFERILKIENIRTTTDMQRGIYATNMGRLLDTKHGRFIALELFTRAAREVMFATPEQRQIILSGDTVAGSALRPFADQPFVLDNKIAPAIPLSEFIFATKPITGRDYRRNYLVYDAAEARSNVVVEAADIPIATIVTSEQSIQLAKFGKGLRVTYEALRQTAVDWFTHFVQIVAVQNEIDKVKKAIDHLVNGDGASTAITNFDMTVDLDTDATSGTLTIKAWLAFKAKFIDSYAMTTAIMEEAPFVALSLLNTGSANVPLASAGLPLPVGLTPINRTGDNIRYGFDSEAPTQVIIGFDRRQAMAQIIEIGATINEIDRVVSNQTETMFITEVMNISVEDHNAIHTLTINA